MGTVVALAGYWKPVASGVHNKSKPVATCSPPYSHSHTSSIMFMYSLDNGNWKQSTPELVWLQHLYEDCCESYLAEMILSTKMLSCTPELQLWHLTQVNMCSCQLPVVCILLNRPVSIWGKLVPTCYCYYRNTGVKVRHSRRMPGRLNKPLACLWWSYMAFA